MNNITYEVMKSFYSILGCFNEDCSNSEIKQLYFAQLRKLHPDKFFINNNNIDNIEKNKNIEQLLLINKAWSVLGLVIY